MTWVNAVIQGVLLGGLYALFACGLSLLYGVMRVINLAHGDLALLGAFGAVFAIDHFGMSAFASMLLVLPLAAALGWGLDRLIFERALRGGELAPLLATFGLSIVISNLLLELFSSDSHAFSAGGLDTRAWHINSQISIAALPALIFLVAVVVLGGLQLFLSHARTGRAMRATADDPVTAELVGIDARRIYAMAAAIAVATAALAGIFNGMRSSFDPSSGSSLLIYGFEAVIIGGLGSLWGTLIGGVVLGVAQTVAAQHNPSWAILAGDFVFLAVLVLRPQGILGVRERRA